MGSGQLFQDAVAAASEQNEKIFTDFIAIKGGLEPAIACMVVQVQEHEGGPLEGYMILLLANLMARRNPLQVAAA